jgi:hypothetical protein
MFHPVGHPMERGWVGRIDGDRVVQLAAQTLQSFFTGGGSAREHAEYPFADVVLLAPVLHPPSVRLFGERGAFVFANPAAIIGPGAVVTPPIAPSDTVSQGLSARPRLAAVIGADGRIGGFTILAEWRADGVAEPKDRDFALGLGPVVVTPDELGERDGFDWDGAIALAAANTALYPGDIVAAPPKETLAGEPGGMVALEVDGIGILEQRVG